MRFLIVFVLLAVSAGFAQSSSFTYLCKVRGRSNVLTINEDANKLVWQGKTFKIKVEEGCGKYGWHAEGPGEAFDFCTATRGYADFEEHGLKIVCDQYLSAVEANEIYNAANTERDVDGAKSIPPPKSSTPVCTKFSEDEKLPMTGFLAISDETHEEHVRSSYIVFLDEPICWSKDPNVVINSVVVTNGARPLLGRHVSFVGKMIAGDSWGAENTPLVPQSER